MTNAELQIRLSTIAYDLETTLRMYQGKADVGMVTHIDVAIDDIRRLQREVDSLKDTCIHD